MTGLTHKMTTLFPANQVRDRIDELVDEIYRAYVNRDVVFIVIADGARRFAEELVWGLESLLLMPQVRYVRARRTEGTTLGTVQVENFDTTDLEGLDVLVIDDIADEGRTLEAVLQLIQDGEPASLDTAVLVNKLERRRVDLDLRYVGFEVAQGWVVGFGMDLDGAYRDLDYIAVVDPVTRPQG